MFDKKALLKRVLELKAKRVLIQVPDGLKTQAVEISKFFEEHGIEAFISLEPCFGACDLRDNEARELGCGALVHIGHSDLGLKTVLPVIYEEFIIDFDPVTLLKRNLEKLRRFKSIGLVTTVQYIDSLGPAKTFLERGGKKAVIGGSEKLNPGQILGCDYSSAKSIENKVDCFLFIGSGRFHPLGLVARAGKPVFFLDIEKQEITEISREREKLEIKRQLRIEKAKRCTNFGILVSTKPGQFNIKEAERIKKKLESAGKSASILVADEITPDKLLGVKIDCLVNTACSRIAEDYKNYGIVIVNSADISTNMEDEK